MDVNKEKPILTLNSQDLIKNIYIPANCKLIEYAGKLAPTFNIEILYQN